MSYIKRILYIFVWENFVFGWGIFWRSVLAALVVFSVLAFGILKVLNDMNFSIYIKSFVSLFLLISLFVIFKYLLSWALEVTLNKNKITISDSKYLWWSVFWRWSIVIFIISFILRLITNLNSSFFLAIILTIVFTPIQFYCSVSALGWAFKKIIASRL